VDSKTLSVVMIGAVLGIVACSPREERAAPPAPVPADPVRTPAPTTNAPPLPDPKALEGPPSARDSAASNPKGDLSAREESTAMPKAGQANNHSSPALDPPQNRESR
jgi:hypothetical protein